MNAITQQKQECPYDPQQIPFSQVIKRLIGTVEIACSASHSVGAYLDLIYWQGVALARDAHVYPPCQPGTLVRRKLGACPKPLINEVFRSAKEITDDEVRTVTRVIFVLTGKNSSWYLQLEGEQGRIFAEDQFDLIQGS